MSCQIQVNRKSYFDAPKAKKVQFHIYEIEFYALFSHCIALAIG